MVATLRGKGHGNSLSKRAGHVRGGGDGGTVPGGNRNLPAKAVTMKDDQHRFLSLLGQLPVRLTGEQAGWVLNCQPHDIPALIHARLLKPLGNPSANSTKYFATADLLEIGKDRAWLVKMTVAINTHW